MLMEQRSLRTGLWPDDKRLGLAARYFRGATNSVLGCKTPVLPTDGDAAARPFERQREENEPRSRDRPTSLSTPSSPGDDPVANEQPTPMPYTRIRPLVARQLALPAWFFSPPPAAC